MQSGRARRGARARRRPGAAAWARVGVGGEGGGRRGRRAAGRVEGRRRRRRLVKAVKQPAPALALPLGHLRAHRVGAETLPCRDCLEFGRSETIQMRVFSDYSTKCRRDSCQNIDYRHEDEKKKIKKKSRVKRRYWCH